MRRVGYLSALLFSFQALFLQPAAQPKTAPATLQWVFSRPAKIEFLRSEVTVAQYRACVRAGKCTEPRSSIADKYCNWGNPERSEHPVNCVDWAQAAAFCTWAGGRLPTAVEWYAEASNDNSRPFPWGGEEISCDRAVWTGGDKKTGCGKDATWAVCSKAAGGSISGLCDMAGNVEEWTSSQYYGDSPRATVVPADILKVVGGSWGHSQSDLFCGKKCSGLRAVSAARTVGIRCVREAAADTSLKPGDNSTKGPSQ